MVNTAQRFGLHDGQIRTPHRLKNNWWFLDGTEIGYGDLNDDDLLNIQMALHPSEVFEGFREGCRFVLNEEPLVRVRAFGIKWRGREPQPRW